MDIIASLPQLPEERAVYVYQTSVKQGVVVICQNYDHHKRSHLSQRVVGWIILTENELYHAGPMQAHIMTHVKYRSRLVRGTDRIAQRVISPELLADGLQEELYTRRIDMREHVSLDTASRGYESILQNVFDRVVLSMTLVCGYEPYPVEQLEDAVRLLDERYEWGLGMLWKMLYDGEQWNWHLWYERFDILYMYLLHRDGGER